MVEEDKVGWSGFLDLILIFQHSFGKEKAIITYNYHPTKTNMEATNCWLVDVFPFPFGAFFRFYVSLWCIESFKNNFELYVYQTCPVSGGILQQNNLKQLEKHGFFGMMI